MIGFKTWRRSYSISMVLIVSFSQSCKNEDPVPLDCDLSDLHLEVSTFTDPTSCQNPDGSVNVHATGGKEPYQYGMNEAQFSDSPAFSNLSAGEVTILVQDANGCERSVSLILGNLQATFDLTSSGCKTANGKLTVTPDGGDAPYRFKIDNGTFGADSTFQHLASGLHKVGIMDNTGCTISVDVAVKTGVSFTDEIQPLITTHCIKAGCHNGDNGNQRNWNSFDEIHAHADMIKEFTSTRFMPPEGEPDLSVEEINLIGCWVDDGALKN